MLNFLKQYDERIIKDKAYRQKKIYQYSTIRNTTYVGMIILMLLMAGFLVYSIIIDKPLNPFAALGFFAGLIALNIFQTNVTLLKYIDFKEEENDKT